MRLSENKFFLLLFLTYGKFKWLVIRFSIFCKAITLLMITIALETVSIERLVNRFILGGNNSSVTSFPKFLVLFSTTWSTTNLVVMIISCGMNIFRNLFFAYMHLKPYNFRNNLVNLTVNVTFFNVTFT